MIFMMTSFSKSSVVKMISVYAKRGVFKFLRFEERFQKVWVACLTVEKELAYGENIQ